MVHEFLIRPSFNSPTDNEEERGENKMGANISCNQ